MLSALFFVFRVRHQSTLPASYALCSRQKNIYTVDETNPRVECCVVSNGRIADTGSISEIKQRWGDKDQTGPVANAPIASAKEGLRFYFIDRDAIVVPGFADAHSHVLEYGFKQQLNLENSGSVEAEVIRRVRSFIEAHPEVKNDTSKWIAGFGWNQNLWSTEAFPTAADLDADPLLRGRPISLERVDGHATWVSTTVLDMMKPLPSTVEGGEIIRDAQGSATGIFVDNARSLIPSPAWTFETVKQYFATTMKDALAHGLTSLHDAGSPPDAIKFFKEMADAEMLPIRLYVMGKIDSNEYWGDQIPRMIDYGNGRLTVRSIKLVSDGALGSWGAAMIEPYSDNPTTKGLLLTPADTLSLLINKFLDDDWQVNVHCIGDQANKIVLDILEGALKGRNASVVRPRIEHAQILRLSDLDRVGDLGVIPSVQPTHATSDMSYAELRIGPDRIKGAYAYQTLIQKSQNHILPIGSDFPVESIDPLKGFYAAIARLTPEGTSPHGPGGWYPAERLTRVQALKGMTYDAAYAAFSEHEFGSIAPGLRADLVVLNKDIMTIPIDQILSTKVTATVVDGSLVYGKVL
ncbi:amidohydrolase family-domain-containing protein [Hysterangium stoloniferum]|nr:amidohydrolase family-domain-containing protein [Hysterangium stoloniferum]